MPKITAETAAGQLAFEAEEGRKLVLCLEDNGVDILHRCGGNAKCTTCRVEILSGDPGEIYRYGLGLVWAEGGPEAEFPYTIYILEDASTLPAQVRVGET